MLRRRTPLVLSLLVALGVAGCGTDEVPQPQWVQPTATSAPSAAPLPAPSSKAEVGERVEAAILDLATFHPETKTATEDNTEAWKLAHPCRDSLPSDRQRTAHHERVWDTDTLWIRQYVVGYLKVSGKKLIDELRSALAKCETYEDADGRTTTVLDSPAPSAPDGTEIMTFCERLKGEHVVHQCTAVLARGNFVTQVDASDNKDLAASQAMLDKLIPLTADALAKAA